MQFSFFKINFKNKQHGQANLCKLNLEFGTHPILYQSLIFLVFQQPVTVLPYLIRLLNKF